MKVENARSIPESRARRTRCGADCGAPFCARALMPARRMRPPASVWCWVTLPKRSHARTSRAPPRSSAAQATTGLGVHTFGALVRQKWSEWEEGRGATAARRQEERRRLAKRQEDLLEWLRSLGLEELHSRLVLEGCAAPPTPSLCAATRGPTAPRPPPAPDTTNDRAASSMRGCGAKWCSVRLALSRSLARSLILSRSLSLSDASAPSPRLAGSTSSACNTSRRRICRRWACRSSRSAAS